MEHAPSKPGRLSLNGKGIRNEEDTIQEACVNWAADWLIQECKLFSIPNGGFRSMSVAKVLKRTGLLAGMPDLGILGPFGCVYLIEMKTATGQMSKSQSEIAEYCDRYAIPRMTCRSLDEFKDTLRQWRLVRDEPLTRKH